MCEELKAQKESEIDELQSNLSRLQAVSDNHKVMITAIMRPSL